MELVDDDPMHASKQLGGVRGATQEQCLNGFRRDQGYAGWRRE
jgi:hypothetical protein